jgi:hypothetical protein
MDSPPGALYAILGFSVLAILLVVMRRRPASAAGPGGRDDRRRDVADRLERLVVEIQDLSRESVAKLDTRIRMMNQLLAECERATRNLEAAARAAAPGPRQEAATEPGPPPRVTRPLHEQVCRLHDQGKDLPEIGAATGLEKGEIELILGLRSMTSFAASPGTATEGRPAPALGLEAAAKIKPSSAARPGTTSDGPPPPP